MHTYTGVPASTGIVVGPVEQIDHGTTGLHRIVCDPFRERALYDVAVVLAKDELRRLSQRAKGPDADILLFQIALLEDESFTNEIGDYIAAGAGGAAAVERAEQIFAGRLKNVDDEYIRERSVDVCDVCRRVVDILDGRPRRRLHLKRPSILVADRFFPSDLFSLDRRMVLGLASDQDSTVSHAAIMARSMGIPAVVQLGGGTAAMAVGHRAILDADNGTLIVEPDGVQIAQADCKIALSRLHGQKPDPVAALPCLTKDGTAFRLMPTCNISDSDVPHTRGAAGIGLVRTETAILYDQSDEVQTTRLRELLKSAELTGLWEKKLRQIEKGTYEAKDFLDELKEMVRQIVINVLTDQSGRSITIEAPAANNSPKEKEGQAPATKEKKSRKPREPKVPTCPICKKGSILRGKSAYGCSEYKNGCTFRLDYATYGAELTDQELIKIIKQIKQ